MVIAAVVVVNVAAVVFVVFGCWCAVQMTMELLLLVVGVLLLSY